MTSRLDTLLGHLSQAMLQEGHRLKAWGFLGTGTGAELLQSGKPHLDSFRVRGKLGSALKQVLAFKVTGATKTKAQVLPPGTYSSEGWGIAKQPRARGVGSGFLFNSPTQKKREAQK